MGLLQPKTVAETAAPEPDKEQSPPLAADPTPVVAPEPAAPTPPPAKEPSPAPQEPAPPPAPDAAVDPTDEDDVKTEDPVLATAHPEALPQREDCKYGTETAIEGVCCERLLKF